MLLWFFKLSCWLQHMLFMQLSRTSYLAQFGGTMLASTGRQCFQTQTCISMRSATSTWLRLFLGNVLYTNHWGNQWFLKINWIWITNVYLVLQINRYCVKILIEDSTGDAIFVIFQRNGCALFNKTVVELFEEKDKVKLFIF